MSEATMTIDFNRIKIALILESNCFSNLSGSLLNFTAVLFEERKRR